MKTIEELAKEVAQDFNKTVEEEGFSDFAEMKKSYMWETSDIKEEVRYMVNEMYGGHMYEDDEVFIDGVEPASYKSFMVLVRKYLK